MLAIVVKESIIFANSLVGTTMQDGGKKEKSNDEINTQKSRYNLIKILEF